MKTRVHEHLTKSGSSSAHRTYHGKLTGGSPKRLVAVQPDSQRWGWTLPAELPFKSERLFLGGIQPTAKQ
jgi:hypothetical protein